MVLENRIAGFRAGMNELMPNVTLPPVVETKPDRSGNFVVWNQAIQANRDALGYADACESGQQNIAKIIEDDDMSAVTVAFDGPEEIRDAVRRGFVLAASPSNHYLQGYIAVLLASKAIHEGKELPQGWAKLPVTIVDSSNIENFIEAWKTPAPGLRAFFEEDVNDVLDAVAKGNFAETGAYDLPPL
ncbi:sugar ABC transporter substrate-binding protein [Ruegeria arenilitoris]|uniref:sugar ABC transporter substrate-binding protein n=1 Tax=Ruegeria arenilitoris TaxID=1173585 RepID=UPI001480DEAB|nr:sugar ABC transporter substrate-binding protein [Ruegeria arenilitoris]